MAYPASRNCAPSLGVETPHVIRIELAMNLASESSPIMETGPLWTADAARGRYLSAVQVRCIVSPKICLLLALLGKGMYYGVESILGG